MQTSKVSAGIFLSVNLLVFSAFARTPPQFGYGCGTGCSTKVKLVSPINGYRSADGRTITYGTFAVQVTGGGRGDLNTTFLRYVLADCDHLSLARLEKPARFTDAGIDFSKGERGNWEKLSGSSYDYTTVVGGRGYYFDALCKKTKFIQKSRITSHQSIKEKGDYFLEKKIWKTAIATYTQGIKLSPRYSALYYNRGLAHLSSGNKKAALADFQETAELFLQQKKWSDYQDAVSMITQINPALANDYKLTEFSRLSLKGIGSIRVGMTIDEASQVAGVVLIKGGGNGSCFNHSIQNQPNGVSFMAVDGRIVRISAGDRTQTLRGIKKGDPESKIISLYPGQIKVDRNPLGGRGNQLTFIPKDLSDKNYRYIFDTSSGYVNFFRSGKLPEVAYLEGCF